MTAPVAGSVTSSALPSDAATHAPPRKAVSSKSDPSVRPAIPGGANVVVMIRSFSDYALSQIVGGLPLKFRVDIGANGAEPIKFRTMDGKRGRWLAAGCAAARFGSYSSAVQQNKRDARN